VREAEIRTRRADEWLDTPLPEIAEADRKRTNRDIPKSQAGDYFRTVYDLMVLAFQTDVTRVATFSLGGEGQAIAIPEIGITESRHQLSHHGGDPGYMEKLTNYDTFAIELAPEKQKFEAEDKLRELFPEPKPEAKPASNENAPGANENKPKPPAKKPAPKKKPELKVEIDFEDILERVKPVTSFGNNERYLMRTADGKTWVFLADILGGYQFWSLPTGGGSLRQLTTMSGGKSNLQLSADGRSVYFLYRDQVRKLTISNGAVSTVPTLAEYEIDRRTERLAVYDEIGFVLDRYFYRPDHQDKEWRKLHDFYRPQVLGAGEDPVFRSINSELMGQLNFSHLGVYGRPGGEVGRGSVLFVPPTEAIANSLQFALLTTLLALVLGLLTAYLIAGRGRAGWLSRLLDPLFMLPLATSAVTLGLGFVIALDTPPLDVRSSPLLILIAHTLVAIPFVVRSVLPALRSIPQNVVEAARVLGASPWDIWRRVELPLISRGLAVGASFAFTVSMGEFGASVFVVRPDTPTMPVVIFRLLGQPGIDSYGQALAMSVLLLAVCAVSFVVIEGMRTAGIGEF